MAYRKLTSPYWTFAAAAVPPGAQKMFEAWTKDQTWWASLPFGWISALFLAVGVGVVLEDLCNPNSALRHNWREWRKFFDVAYVGAFHQDKPYEHVELLCLLKFKKARIDALLTVRYVENSFRGPVARIAISKKIQCHKDGELRLRFGCIPISSPGWTPRYPVWGEELASEAYVPGQPSILVGMRYIVLISVAHQTYRVFIEDIPAQVFHWPRIYVIGEDDAPLPR